MALVCCICRCDGLPQSPVVSPCGHLFCWRCIYLRMKEDNGDNTTCPICYSRLAESELIPIYDHGSSSIAEEVEDLNIHSSHAATTDIEIPDRPKARPISEDELIASERHRIIDIQGFSFPASSLQKVQGLRLFILSCQREEGSTEDEYHFEFCASPEESSTIVISPGRFLRSRYMESRIVMDPDVGPLYFVGAPQNIRDEP
ncbi:hypothetical protein KP509_14G070800 [Ceratopteris richardii]|uniref:RING-type E3 ubiquitin transferase n=1 Tax=Ceratopteris richardii TaxID=49495 RepID=A0A8T2TE52_CERRI|nr:hypothetical protein KP509_14G070800 [Ceratopteris richardii]